MRGLDRLRDIRRHGLRPADSVLLIVPGMSPPWRVALEGELLCEQQDRPAMADLRALVGLRVIVVGESGQFAEAVQWVNAARVAGAHEVGVAFGHPQESWIDGPVWVRVAGNDLVAEEELG